MLVKQQEEFQKSWEATISDVSGNAEGINLDLSLFDADIREHFNNYGGHPLTQLMFLMTQVARAQIKTQLFVQGIAAKLAGVEAPETEAATEEISGDSSS